MVEAPPEGLIGLNSIGMAINDFDTPGFVFGEGDVIDITWNSMEGKLTFERRNGIEKVEMGGDSAEGEMQFFVILSIPGDVVEVVEEEVTVAKGVEEPKAIGVEKPLHFGKTMLLPGTLVPPTFPPPKKTGAVVEVDDYDEGMGLFD